MTKTKREMRQEAIERLRRYIDYTIGYRNAAHAMLGDKYFDISGEECIRSIIDLLTDDDEDMGDYIKLPKDANGEVIELWDKITYHGPYSRCRDRVFEVRGYCARGRTIAAVFVNCDGDYVDLAAKECRHYHKPTVEELLSQFADKLGRWYDADNPADSANDVLELVTVYAKKLQLREDKCE